jgi:hypothetical protein
MKKTNVMKKLFLLFLLVFVSRAFGQTYDLVIAYERQPTDEKRTEYQNSYPTFSQELLGFTLKGPGTRHIKIKSSENNNDYHINDQLGYYFKNTTGPQLTYINFKVPAETIFIDYYIEVGIFNAYGQPVYSIDQGDDNIEFDDLIHPGKNYQYLKTYMGNFYIQSFNPNVSVFLPPNRDPANGIKTICANEQFGVFAYPQGFPSLIYNWQYSLDNKGTWRDVPDEFHVYNPNFTIADLLGSNHLNYIGKTIYFRMGYDSMVFAGGLEFPLIYSACAPLVNRVAYQGPSCYGDKIPNVTVTFDRNLNSGEELRYFQLKAVNPNTNLPDGTPPIIYPFIIEGSVNNGLVTKFEEKSTGVFTYTMSNFGGLNPNSTYQVQYQAFENNANKGLSLSSKSQNFKYEPFEPVKFEFIKADNPLCAGDPVAVVLNVTGGTIDDYYFYVDDVEVSATKNPDDGFYYITGLNPSAENNIKVIDSNGCIEKATN